MREIFLKIQYSVCWAGCNLSFKDRTFDRWDQALELYNLNKDKLSLRIEEISTKTQVKIVLPESKS